MGEHAPWPVLLMIRELDYGGTERQFAEIAKGLDKLNNPAFTQKAPPQVLLEHQKRLGDWQTKRERVAAALAALEG